MPEIGFARSRQAVPSPRNRSKPPAPGACTSRPPGMQAIALDARLVPAIIVFDGETIVAKPVISWDGKNLPDALKGLPPGRYALEPVQDPVTLSQAEEQGILDAMRELDAGKGRSLAEVVATFQRRSPGK